VCKFFATMDGCKRGDKCIFAHETAGGDRQEQDEKVDPLRSIAPCIESLSLPADIFDWFEKRHRELLLLGDGNFDFTRSLSALGVAPRYATDVHAAKKKIGITDIFGLDATRAHTTNILVDLVRNAKVTSVLWNFPFTDDEADDSNESLMLGTMHSLLEAFRQAACTSRSPLELTFAVVLQGDQFSRWNMSKSALRTGWRLHAWGEFDLSAFPGYKPRRANGEAFIAGSPRLYEFKIHPHQLAC
jgi:Domain of unknown function (DUF2431)